MSPEPLIDRQVIFELGSPIEPETKNFFGLAVNDVWQITQESNVTKVPLAPNIVEGIINIHGRIITVINPTDILGIKTQITSLTQIIILNRPRSIGLNVSKTHNIIPFSKPTPVNKPLSPCIYKVFQEQNSLIHLIDVPAFIEQLNQYFKLGPQLEQSTTENQGVHP